MKRRGFLTAPLALGYPGQTPARGSRAQSREAYPMKLGMSLSAAQISDTGALQILRQLDVTHIIAHAGLYAGVVPGQEFWEYDDLLRLKKHLNSHGLELASMESLPNPHCYKIMLDLPGKEAQIENIKKTIRNMGRAGIPVLGYHFSFVKVWHGPVKPGVGRAGARLISFDYELAKNGPLMTMHELLGTKPGAGPAEYIQPVSQEEMWDRLTYFLKSLVPVAAEANVRLAAHPNDPPVSPLRGEGRPLVSHEALQRLVDIVPSHYNGINFCQGTVAEMGQDIYAAIRRFGTQKKICYVHFRNIRGNPPHKL